MKINANIVTPETEQTIREIGIPPCPQVLIDLMNEVRSNNTDFNRISHLISKDVGLSAAVLKIANSPFYGLRHKANSIQGALLAVGLRSAANLIAGLMLRRAFALMDPVAMNEFWESTSKVGLTTAYLGRELGIADINEAHTFALFRDCGTPLLMDKFPDYRRIIKAAEAEGTQRVTDMERVRFGVDHATIGANLAMSWYLPEEIWQPIQLHHAHQELAEKADSQRGTKVKLVALATLADCMFRTHHGVATSEHWEREEKLAFALLGMRREEIEPLQSDISRILSGE